MRVITPGHKYALNNFENPGIEGHVVQFIEKMPLPSGTIADGAANTATLVTINDGTTNEEVLAMMIDRLDSLYVKVPSVHTDIARSCCRAALQALELRTAQRKSRGVEGTRLV
jgi:hypothetical protein